MTSNAKRESTQDRRAAIATAARALIVEKGLEGLRTRDIAARVGINIATLHYHVPTKEALVALVAESLRDDFRNQALSRPRTGKTGLEQLRMEFDDFRETVEDMPDLIIVLTDLVERGRRDPVVGEIVGPLYGYWRGQLSAIFRRGVEEGSFRSDIDPEVAALIVTGTLSDFWRFHTDSRTSLESVFGALEQIFVKHDFS